MRRTRVLGWLAVVAAAAAVTPAAGAAPTARRVPDGLAWVDRGGRPGPPLLRVPVKGGHPVVVPVPGLRGDEDLATLRVKATRGPRTQHATAPDDPGVAPPATNAGPAPADRAAQFPAVAAPQPGTVVSIAGGDCDGYPLREATIHPHRIEYGRDGLLYWVDSDLHSHGTQNWYYGSGHGSVLLRRSDTAGRVRTIAPLFAPIEGRIPRQLIEDTFVSHVVPDGRGGVFANVSAQGGGTAFETPRPPGSAPPGDTPTGGAIVHIAPDGNRTLIAGGAAAVGDRQVPPLTDEPARGAEMLVVQSFTLDTRGNVYLAETAARKTIIRFVNRGRTPVTFFAGTEQEKTVQPGDISPIAGHLAPPDTFGQDVTLPVDVEAARASIRSGTRVIVRGSLLYYLDSVAREITAVNLGFEDNAQTSHGVVVRPGYAVRLAGNRTLPAGYTGDLGPARLATFNFVGPYVGDMALGPDGTLTVADSFNHRVRAIDPTLGVIRTVAGVGVHGYDGEGQPAALTRIWHPLGITVDPQGRVVFADASNARVRRIEPDGRLVTVAGRGPTGCGSGHLATGRTVTGGAYVGHVGETTADSRGNVYAVLVYTRQIVRIGRDGVIRDVVGRPQRCEGLFYHFERGTPDDPCPASVGDGDGGPVAAARLAAPMSILADAYDNLYVVDLDRIRYANLGREAVTVHGVTVEPGTIATVRVFPAREVTVEIPTATSAGIREVQPLGDIALDDHGTLFVSDPWLHLIYRMGPCADFGILAGSGRMPLVPGDGDGGKPLAAGIHPMAMVYDRKREILLFADRTPPSLESGHNARIRAINLSGKRQRYLGRTLEPGVVDTVAGAGVCPPPKEAHVTPGALWQRCSHGDGRDAYSAVFSTTFFGGLGVEDMRDGPHTLGALALGPRGRLYVMDTAAQRIRVVLPDGKVAGIAAPWPEGWIYGSMLHTPFGYRGDGGRALDAWLPLTPASSLTVDARGDLVVATSHRIRKIVDPLRAQLRTASRLPGVVGAGRGFSEPVTLHDDDGIGLADGTTGPDVVLHGGVPYVVARRGSGRGCDLWRITLAARPDGTDTAGFRGHPLGGAAGVGVGGAECGLASNGTSLAAASVVRSRDLAPDDPDVTIATGRSADAGSAWDVDPTTGVLDRLGASRLGDVALAASGSGYELAYRTAADVAVASSPDGKSYVENARIPVASQRIGDLVVSGRHRYLGLVVPAFGRNGEQQVALAVARSVGGSPWQVVRVAPLVLDATSARGPITSRPSIAVDASGAVYVTWHDGQGVFLARSTNAGASWSVPVAVPGGGVNAMPTVAAGRRGAVAVAFYGTPLPGAGSAADPYAVWYVYVARSRDALSAAPSFTRELATTNAAHVGAMCSGPCAYGGTAQVEALPFRCAYTSECPVAKAATETAFGSSPGFVGEVRARLGEDGVLNLAFTTDAGALANAGSASAITYVRACAGLSLVDRPKALPCREARPEQRPNAGPDDGLIAPDPVAVPGIGPCATPPKFREPAVPRRDAAPEPRPEPERQHGREPARPPAVAIPAVPLPPAQPALPPGQAPAPAQQLSQAQQQAMQGQSATQVGVAAEEEEEAQRARNFAYSRPSSYPAAPALWLLTMLGATTTAVALRRRGHPARATVRSRR